MQVIRLSVLQHRKLVERRGSTLVIVVALLGMLSFLGFVFYTFAKQERVSAVSFSEAAKNTKTLNGDPDSVFDFALQQVILGPQDKYFQSILWGGRHSLLANMLGRDGAAWNGEGVNLTQDSTGTAYVDMNYNGSYTDLQDNQALLGTVDSLAANPTTNTAIWNYAAADAPWGHSTSSLGTFVKYFRGTGNTAHPASYIPEPDTNYNSPDVNSMFLSYDGVAVSSSATSLTPTRVMIPSFLRPQYLRNSSGPIQNWFQNATANQMMRPHPGHVSVYCAPSTTVPVPVIYSSSAAPTNSPQWPDGNYYVPRFISSNELDPSTSEPIYLKLGLRQPFTYHSSSTSTSFAPPSAGTGTGALGVWNASSSGGTSSLGTNGVTTYEHDLDVDTDGDGITDAILMDLGYPPIRRGDGKLVVPLFAISIRDLNGLLNVNATGNMSGNMNLDLLTTVNGASPAPSPPDEFGYRQTYNAATSTVNYVPDNLSKSNLGMSAFEINPQRALTADPFYNSSTATYNDPTLGASATSSQLGYFLGLFDSTFRSSGVTQAGRSIPELANLEWFLLNSGVPYFQPGIASGETVALILNSISDLVVGRLGELSRMRAFLTSEINTDQPKPGLSLNVSSGTLTNWPTTSTVLNSLPVQYSWESTSLDPNPDDNQNFSEGEGIRPQSGVTGTNYNIRYGTPLDFLGSGQQFMRNPWQPVITSPSNSPHPWGPDGQPGTAGIDDDNDGNIDNLTEEGYGDDTPLPATSSAMYGAKSPALQQMTSNLVYGYASKTASMVAPAPATTPVLYPLFWPVYSGYQSFYGTGLTTALAPNLIGGGVRWGEYQSTSSLFYPLSGSTYAAGSTTPANPPLNGLSLLMRGSPWYSLLDDPSEMVIDRTIGSSGYVSFLSSLVKAGVITQIEYDGLMNSIASDGTFGPEEIQFLQGNTSDGGGSVARSRLSQLMPANLVASQNASDIRKRFTTVSQDRREFGVGNSRVGGTPTTAGAPYGLRSWEFQNPAGSTTLSFPPVVGAVGGSSGTGGTSTNAGNPYRPELYSYLLQQANSIIPSTKLNVNRWLYQDQSTGKLSFAQLPEQTSPNDINATFARQMMARDIYTLLYTLCSVQADSSGDVDIDYRLAAPTSYSPSPTYGTPTPTQAREMAQFAINLVDALDGDSTITAFYYDPDLSQNSLKNNAGNVWSNPGWDPLAFAGPNQTPQDYDDFVVYGVERQQLAISESAMFAVQYNATDVPNTIFLDQNTPAAGRLYMFFELQNVSPTNVILAPKTDYLGNNLTWRTVQPNLAPTAPATPTQGNANWRVSLIDPNQPSTVTAQTNTSNATLGQPTVLNTLYFLPGLDATHNYVLGSGPSTTSPYQPYLDTNLDVVLPPGALFSVSCQDGSDTVSNSPRTSDFRQGTSTTGPYPLMIPSIPANGQPETTVPTASTAASSMTPACNLDLVWTAGIGTTNSYGDSSPIRFWQSVNSDPVAGFPNTYSASASTSGAFIAGLVGKATSGAPYTYRLSLETQAAAGPSPSTSFSRWTNTVWVSVDNTTNTSNGNIAAGTKPSAIDTAIPQAVAPANIGTLTPSYPRAMPLLSGTAPIISTAASINTASTIPLNPPAGSAFTNFVQSLTGTILNGNMIPWQWQPDREFASLGELLYLPLYGPESLTAALAQVVTPSPVQISTSEFYSSWVNNNLVTITSNGPTGGGPYASNMSAQNVMATGTNMVSSAPVYYPSVAAARFLRSDNPDYTLNIANIAGATTLPTNYGNRWYRLLDFLEVSNRGHRHPAIMGIPPVVSVSGVTPAPIGFPSIASISTDVAQPVTFSNSSGAAGSTAYSLTGTTAANANLLTAPFNFPQFYGWPTTHGQINLNMIRHPQVLHALLDDDEVIYDARYYQNPLPSTPTAVTTTVQGYVTTLASSGINSPANYYPMYMLYSMDQNDASASTPRLWWLEFLKSRDSRYNSTSAFQTDPVTGLYMPGTANARPFKGFDVVGTTANNTSTHDSPIEDTLFRSLPLDSQTSTTPNQSRRLFEVGNNLSASGGASQSDFYPFTSTGTPLETSPPQPPTVSATTPPNAPLHPTARHRLLTKIMNNTSTRSNSFAVFMTVQYYEAAEVQGSNGTAVRIGGQLNEIPTNRAFFVIDRTGAVDQMRLLDANGVNPVSAGSYSFQPNTDTTGLRANMNGIRWRDLVLYRQTLN